MAKPVFVVGPHRSGTTWLANILCRHSNVVGIQSSRHQGIHESAFFSHVDRHFGKWNSPNDFIELVETFSTSDYFSLSELNKEIFYENQPANYGDFFRVMMDRYAEEKGADYWVEKTPAHTIYLGKIQKYFPDGNYLGITRKGEDVIRSAVGKRTFRKKQRRLFFVLRQILHLAKYKKHIKHYNEKIENMYLFKYENLKANKAEIVQDICDLLDLPFEEKLMEPNYPPNSSFKDSDDSKKREETLTSTEINLIRFLGNIVKLFPYPLYRSLQIFQDYSRPNDLPDWFWKIYKREINSDLSFL